MVCTILQVFIKQSLISELFIAYSQLDGSFRRSIYPMDGYAWFVSLHVRVLQFVVSYNFAGFHTVTWSRFAEHQKGRSFQKILLSFQRIFIRLILLQPQTACLVPYTKHLAIFSDEWFNLICSIFNLHYNDSHISGKIGYGTVSEALAYKVPLIFVRREYFNEEPFVRNMLEVHSHLVYSLNLLVMWMQK